MSKEQKRMFFHVLANAVLFAVALLLSTEGWLRLFTFLILYAVIVWDVLWRAARNTAHGQVSDGSSLTSLATVGTLATGGRSETIFVILLYQVDELFQNYAVDQSRKPTISLTDIRPDCAGIEVDGQLRQVDSEDVAMGDTIVIKAGECILLDGVVLEGISNVDTAALIGESLPRETQFGDDVISDCVNLSGLLRVRVTKVFEEPTAAKILGPVENSSGKKAKAENFITKSARCYTPVVVLAAVALALLPPLSTSIQWVDSVRQTLNFLVISCPCTLVISVSLFFFGGIGGAPRNSILVEGGNYLEALTKTGLAVFDKTGALTRDVFNVTAIHPDHYGEAQLLELAIPAESYSDHPISRSLKETYGKKSDISRVSNVEELSGRGVQIAVDGRQICAGDNELMEDIGVSWYPCHRVSTTVYMASDGAHLGYTVTSDETKPDMKETITALKAHGVCRTIMFTDDAKAMGESVAQEPGPDEVHTQLLPANKVIRTEALLGGVSPKGALASVGDDINDVLVLSRVDVGVTMDDLGSDAAIEAVGIVLMDDKPSEPADAIRIARRTLAIVRQDIAFVLTVRFLVLVLSTVGIANMWGTMFADAGVSVITILNAMWALKTVK